MSKSTQAPSEQHYLQQLSIDCVIFGYEDQQLKVLVPTLNFAGDFHALPSGFIHQQEDIDQAARRILAERTGLTNVYLDQFRTFGAAHRSNRAFLDRLIATNAELLSKRGFNQREYDWLTQRFVAIGYYALMDIRKVTPRTGSIDLSVAWYPIGHLPALALDQGEMVHCALETLRLHLDQKLLAYQLLPDTFTMKELQELYEAVYDRPFARNNFQKKILEQNVLERLEKKFTGAANKAPYLYRWKHPVS